MKIKNLDSVEVDKHHKVVAGKDGHYLVKKAKSDLDKRLSESEEVDLLASFTYKNHKSNALRNKWIVQMFLNTGLRVNEMASLKMYDVLDATGEVKKVLELRPETAKRAKSRQIPLNAVAREAVTYFSINGTKPLTSALISKKNGDPLTRRSLQDVVRNSGLRAGVERLIGPHTLRHTFLSKVYVKHKNVKITQQLAGHSDPKLTMQLYTHTTIDEMAEAVEDL